jgi:hypothetical protein
MSSASKILAKAMQLPEAEREDLAATLLVTPLSTTISERPSSSPWHFLKQMAFG